MADIERIGGETKLAQQVDQKSDLLEQVPELKGFFDYAQSPEFREALAGNSTEDLILSFMAGDSLSSNLGLSKRERHVLSHRISEYREAIARLDGVNVDIIGNTAKKWLKTTIGDRDFSAPSGKICLNIDLPQAENVHNNVVGLARAYNVGMTIRLPYSIKQQHGMRPDKMNIVFSEPDSEKVLSIIQEMAATNELATQKDIPFGTKQLRDINGILIPGASFSTQGAYNAPSFTSTRCAALHEIAMGAMDGDTTLEEWQKTCAEHDIDPFNMAFNASTPPDQFACFK